ncbi:MAG: 3-deoxy-manno-octulosonate cytidylyltransferase [Armatimonadota bacterium]|nr:3-deoxy-manno-octulosonate cytidylyltransferase [bacterium]MDW8289634.1 3-deoxy-manno-octulosonate cytidylyltransferase [Armatimonadota bacterium]
MDVIGMIPARLAAVRLPNKPLLDIAGKPMIWWVWHHAKQAQTLREVMVVTPDEEIAEVVRAFGGVAVMTSPRHRSGTERLAEAAQALSADIIVNIQGDEPLMPPGHIDAVVRPLLEDPTLSMSSLMCPATDEEKDKPSVVKVVVDRQGNALYFSRSRIPYPREPSAPTVTYKHLGIYAYRRDFLLQYAAMEPTPLEQMEMLEQLRVLENGYRIRMVRVEQSSIGVDTEEDLERVRAILSQRREG